MDYTDDYPRISVRLWQSEGLLEPGYAFSFNWMCDGEALPLIDVRAQADRVIFSHRHGGNEWKDQECTVMLEWVPCNMGKRRAWFLCPAAGCGRPVGHLYGQSIFTCRHCRRLSYRSQIKKAERRGLWRVDKIRARMGWMPGIMNPAGGKPKWMHWKTYWRLVAEYDASAKEWQAGMERRFGIKIDV